MFAAASSLLSLGMGAQTVYAADGLIEEIKNYGFTAGAWANAGITYNATDPKDNFNGPVTFADRSAEFQLNQLNAFIQKAVAAEGSSWDFGGRADVMFGTDSIFTQAYGVAAGTDANGNPLDRGTWDLGLLGGSSNRFYDIAVPQAYLESYIPVGNGLNLKVGRFYTPIGYETVPAPDNFFYTHAYTMQFGEPFTHTGFMGNYTVNKNWAVMAGAVTGSSTGGWDGSFDQQNGNWAGLMGVTFTADNGTSLNIAGTHGSVSETNSGDWSLYSAVLKHNITEKTHLVLQHDHGFADKVLADGGDATWYGVNSHLYYDIKDDLAIGIRGEWFRDQNGARVCYPARTTCPGLAGTYYEVTAGLTWKPKSWLSLRPNVRYDWVEDHAGSVAAGNLPFDAGSKDSQFLFSTDVTVKF